MAKILDVRNLHRSFADNSVIHNLSFSITEEEHIIIFAPSGCGKTTLLRILLGLDKDYSGHIHRNVSLAELSVVFQNSALLPHRTVKENILYPMQLLKQRKNKFSQEEYDNWLKVVELEKYQSYYPYQLSSGMQKRVSIVRSFLYCPRLVLMDEPFSSLDFELKRKIQKFIVSHYSHTGKILITHHIEDFHFLKKFRVLLFKQKPLQDYQTFFLDIEQKENYNMELNKILNTWV